MNYVVYKRLSKEDATNAYLGLDAQQTAIDKFIESNPGSVIIDTFQEIVTGTGKKERPIFLAAVNLCKITNSTLLCSRLDRMARSVFVVSSLMEAKINFVALDAQNFSPLTINILASVAQEEARVISTRVKAALVEAKKRGTVLGAKGRLNLTDEAKALGRTAGIAKIKENSVEFAKSLEPIIRDCQRKDMSLSDIARHLTRIKVQTSRGNTNWYPSGVRNLIKILGG